MKNMKLTEGPIVKNMLLFALPMMLVISCSKYIISQICFIVDGLSVPTHWRQLDRHTH